MLLRAGELSPVFGPSASRSMQRLPGVCIHAAHVRIPAARVIACGRDSWPSPWLAGCAQRSLPFDLGLRFCRWWSLATTWPRGRGSRFMPFDLGLRFCGWWSLATTWPRVRALRSLPFGLGRPRRSSPLPYTLRCRIRANVCTCPRKCTRPLLGRLPSPRRTHTDVTEVGPIGHRIRHRLMRTA